MYFWAEFYMVYLYIISYIVWISFYIYSSVFHSLLDMCVLSILNISMLS